MTAAVARRLLAEFAGIAPRSVPAFIAAQVIGGTRGTALAVVLYPGRAGQPSAAQEPARLAG